MSRHTDFGRRGRRARTLHRKAALFPGPRPAKGISPNSARVRRWPPVPGLRREDVATLAGISAEYYTRLERGNVTGA
ncbi:hypothetical protein Areg01_81080 [Actinoplanes regularis]|nr:hypothetical protein Areg01_81080 [Actinoplanes regularis]